MRTFGLLAVGSLLASVLAAAPGCGSDEPSGTGAAGTPGGTGASGASGAEGGAGGGSGEGGAGAEGGAGGGGGVGGEGPCDPTATPQESSCVLTEELGIFVRNEGDDTAAGTRDAPVKSLQTAIDLAAEQGKRVYACGSQTFLEEVTVPAGTAIFGGLDCESDWAWQNAKSTRLTATAGKVPMRLTAGAAASQLEDLQIEAASADSPGGSSIAVVADQATATFTRCSVQAGDGADGEGGADVGGMASPGPAGTAATGDNGCSGAITVGPDGATNPLCNTSVGGRGGDSTSASSANGQDGGDGLPAAAASGLGGGGQKVGGMLQIMCSNGSAGAPGMAGDPGVAGAAFGQLDAAGYTSAAGGAGAPGQPGQGGGGGGGLAGCASSSGKKSGGSGGAGGCGGVPAQGGSGGGASVAIVSLDSTLTLVNSVVVAGNGGRGGDGGLAEGGGNGGAGGLGGCSGGAGGKGGDGGGGGGGGGGPSIAIAYVGTAPGERGTVTVTPGVPGNGGLGAATANDGAIGLAGDAVDVGS